jgi:hypothetical protein
MKHETKSNHEQAAEYLARVGVAAAKNSNHYGVGQRHCHCGTCFCCEVFIAVNVAESFAKHPAPKALGPGHYEYRTVPIDSPAAARLQAAGHRIVSTALFSGTVQFEIVRK